MKNRTVLIALMLVAAGDALIGCTLTAPIESPDVPTATFKPLDVTVGVFFTPEFENYTYVRTPPPKSGSASILFELGPPSRELFSQLFEATFRETVLVNSHIAASDGGTALDAIIELTAAARSAASESTQDDLRSGFDDISQRLQMLRQEREEKQ